MGLKYELEEKESQYDGTGSYVYLHYRTDVPIKCDLFFRRFVTCSIFDGAVLVPCRSGPGRKVTIEGVVKIAAGSAYPTRTQYKDSLLKWTPVTEYVFEEYKKESATKVYFRGFPLEATQSIISSYFNDFGNLQYVYVMCDSSQKRRTNKQGYVIFEARASVERLFANGNSIHYLGNSIYIEEYKSKNSKVIKDSLPECFTSGLARSNQNNTPNDFQNSLPLKIASNTPATCAKSPYYKTNTRDCSYANSLTAIRAVNFKRPTFINLSNSKKVSRKSVRIRLHLSCSHSIEMNCYQNNLRFNKQSRSEAITNSQHQY